MLSHFNIDQQRVEDTLKAKDAADDAADAADAAEDTARIAVTVAEAHARADAVLCSVGMGDKAGAYTRLLSGLT